MAPPAPGPWTDLGAGVLVRRSEVFAMNSVALLHADRSVLVDPGVLPSELDDIARVAATGGGPAVTLLFTHADWDHVLGRAWWPGAATVAHERFAGELRRSLESVRAAARDAAAGSGERWEREIAPFRPDTRASGVRFLRIGPWRVVLRDASGHSACMLSAHLPERRLLIAGDMLSDVEIPILQQPPAVYRRTLLELRPLADHGAVETLVPGHGSIARGRDAVLERLDRDLRYLEDLERGVRAAIDAGLGPDEVQERLGALDYVGKRAPYSMVENHRNNVRLTHEGAIAAVPGPGSRRG